jgi:hypothetical protein
MEENKYGWKNFFDFGEILRYYFRKKNSGGKPNFNLTMMHGINRISIIIFIAAILFLILKHIF